jgi:hypothetical protein
LRFTNPELFKASEEAPLEIDEFDEEDGQVA